MNTVGMNWLKKMLMLHRIEELTEKLSVGKTDNNEIIDTDDN